MDRGRSGGAKVLGKLPVPGRPTIWITVGQGLTALAVGAGGGCLDIFTLIYPFSPLSPSLWETARYRLKYCLKGPLNPKQPTNQLNGYYFVYIISNEVCMERTDNFTAVLTNIVPLSLFTVQRCFNSDQCTFLPAARRRLFCFAALVILIAMCR